jgi:hypothetical protein
MALARRDHLLLPRLTEPVIWPLGPAGMILERCTHRLQSPLTEFIEIAAANPELGGDLGGLLSPEQCQDGLQATFLWGKAMG